jgi:hypothetical protein
MLFLHRLLLFSFSFFQSQKPDVLGLQRRLYFQLLKEHMPKNSEGSLSEQHAALTDALTGRTMLLAIDGTDDLSTNSDFD